MAKMKRFVYRYHGYRAVLYAAVFCMLLAGCGGGAGDSAFGVMTYNIHHGEGVDGGYDTGRIAAFLNERGADVIALQEVDRRYSARSRLENQPRLFGEKTGFHRFYGPNIGGAYGNLVLTRSPYIQAYNVPLPNPENKEPRGVIVMEIHAGGGSLTVLNTHLSAFSAKNREAQIEKIIDLAETLKGPFLVAGDFNALPSDQLSAFGESGLLFSSRESAGIGEGIDDIYVSEELKNRIKSGTVIEKPYSDHPAYFITLDLSGL
jgi:endonuclease/exonuclease/phosphatase (EEP) superfamily protein YafD